MHTGRLSLAAAVIRVVLSQMRTKPDCDEGGSDLTEFPVVWKAPR